MGGIAMTGNSANFSLSALESQIPVAIDHAGWYAYLWFPIVYREVLNFSSDAPDEEVRAAFGTLIRKCALLNSEAQCEVPDWKPATGALESARETVSLSLDLRTKDGNSQAD
jgi:hypothetical protein